MISSDLKATAVSFIPGGALSTGETTKLDDSFSAYMDFVADIDDAMDNDGSNEVFNDNPSPTDVGTVSGLPSHLAKYANEFWFPESRDCVCCKGFKYGCQCAPTNGGCCSSCCPEGGGASNPLAASLQPSLPLSPQSPVDKGQGRHDRNQKICKFFLSSNGCRFGQECRFLHA